MNAPRRRKRLYVPRALRSRHAERRWQTLALNAGVDRACDARSCAKRAKVRKQAWRCERRAVRQLLNAGPQSSAEA
jgi:hypothetical protein